MTAIATLAPVFAAAPEIDAGNTAWVLTCTAMVLLMTPGLAFFYAGMVRAKNALAMIMQNYICMAVVSVTWVLLGYTLAFGDGNGFFGGFRYTGLAHMSEPVPGPRPSPSRRCCSWRSS